MLQTSTNRAALASRRGAYFFGPHNPMSFSNGAVLVPMRDVEKAKRIARARNAVHSGRLGNEAKNAIGVVHEIAQGLFLGIKPALSTDLRDKDAGDVGPFESRGRAALSGTESWMPIRVEDAERKGDRVFISSSGAPGKSGITYIRINGWLWGKEAEIVAEQCGGRNLADCGWTPGKWKDCFFIPPWELRPMWSLPSLERAGAWQRAETLH